MCSMLDDLSDPRVTAAIEQNNIDLFFFAAAVGRKTILREGRLHRGHRQAVVAELSGRTALQGRDPGRPNPRDPRGYRAEETAAPPEVWSELSAAESEDASREQRVRGDGSQSFGNGDAIGHDGRGTSGPGRLQNRAGE